MAAAPSNPPRLLPSGDSAITVEFSKSIDEIANQRVLSLDRALASEPIAGVTETVPTYRSLLVHYDPVKISFDTLSERLAALAQRPASAAAKARRWRIPVAYGGDNGFTPGWSYLSGLDKSLHLSRRQNPRVMTPAGTVSIGGVQTGVQCLAGPSGWHLLGRTPVRTYQFHRDPTFLLEPGDRVTFVSIDAQTFAEQDRAAEAGEIVAELLPS